MKILANEFNSIIAAFVIMFNGGCIAQKFVHDGKNGQPDVNWEANLDPLFKMAPATVWILEYDDLVDEAVVQTLSSKISLIINTAGIAPLIISKGGIGSIVFESNPKNDNNHFLPYRAFLGEDVAKKPIRIVSWDWENKIDSVFVLSKEEMHGGWVVRITVRLIKNSNNIGIAELVYWGQMDQLKLRKIRVGDEFSGREFLRMNKSQSAYINGTEMIITRLSII